MEQIVRGVAEAYEELTLPTKVIGEDGKIPTWMFGRNTLYNNVGPPSVTWIPGDGTIEAPKVGTAVVTEDAQGIATPPQRSRVIVDRMLTFEVLCNGLSYEQAENLMTSVIAAVRASQGVETPVTGENWITEQEATHDNALNKFLVMITVDMRLTVLDEQRPLTVITAQQHTEDIDNTLEC